MRFPSRTSLDIYQPEPAPNNRFRHPVPHRQLITLGDYFRLCREHLPSLITIVAIGCTLGFIITQFQVPVFRAEASIELWNINPNFLNLRRAKPLSDASEGPADLQIDTETQIEVIRSAGVMEKTIESASESELPEKWERVEPRWAALVGNPPRPAPPRESFKAAADSVYVRRIGQTRLILLQADGSNPIVAADFLNSLIREYIKQNIGAREQLNREAEDLTRNQLAATRNNITQAEVNLEEYAKAHHLIYGSDQQNLSDDELKQMQADLLQARTELAARNAERQVAAKSDPNTLPQVVKDANLRDLRAQLIDVRRREAELSTVYLPEYDAVKKVRADAAQLEQAIREETAKVVSGIESEFQQARETEKELSTAYDSALAVTARTSEAATEYGLMKRDIEVSLAAYERTLSQARDLNLAAALKMNDVHVVDPAVPPKRPRSPRLGLNMAMGCFASFIFGVGWLAGRKSLDDEIRAPGDLTRLLQVDELGVVASALQGNAIFRRLQEIRGRLLPASEVHNSPVLGGPVTDDFASIATSLLYSSSGVMRAKTIVFTSTAPREGKTTVSVNVASTLARAGRSVLLIDGDVRRPILHTSFGLENDCGLTNLLEERASAADAGDAIKETGVPRLRLLPGGSIKDSAADLLFQPHLRKLLAEFRGEFDVILIDAPPMTQWADARTLANAADGVVLIARSKRTTRESIRAACERLRCDGARLLGVVLNDYKAESAFCNYYA
jgi:succinoglycan biosynthesis transport protein ExoP